MVVILVDDDLLVVLPGVPAGPEEQIPELAVLELYRRQVISSGKAADLLKRERGEFICCTDLIGILYLDLDEIELARELEGARTLR